MREYKYMALSEIRKYEPEMRKEEVSLKARSSSGFLSAYKRADGNPDRLSEYWKRKRHGFIKRTMAQYLEDRGYRRYLSLIAWAYMPNLKPVRR